MANSNCRQSVMISGVNTVFRGDRKDLSRTEDVLARIL
jgi:hypothetical protein